MNCIHTTEKPSFWEEQARLWRSMGKAGVARREINTFTCGSISSRYLANLDSLGLGPDSIRHGQQRIYPLETLVAWLEKRTETVSHRKAGERHD